jgi:hypothetical protein
VVSKEHLLLVLVGFLLAGYYGRMGHFPICDHGGPVMSEEDSRDTAYNQIVTIYGYQPHPQYGEWLLDGDNGPRPCRLENWPAEDLSAYVGGKHTIIKETNV